MFDSDSLPKKFIKYSIILFFKEGYLFIKNWFGLMQHPFKTIRSLIREKDYSQIFLVFGLPVYFLFIGLFVIWTARRIVGATPGIWGIPTKSGIIFLFFIFFILFTYLSFWIIKVFKSTFKYR